METSAKLVSKEYSLEKRFLSFRGIVTGMSLLLDRAAGVAMFAIMALIVCNVIFRALLGKAILGTYEYAGYLTAVMIAFSLANCAIQKGHIAVDFIMERFSSRMQAWADILTNGISLCFWVLSAWHVGLYAHNLALRGVVSPTTQTPFYFFIYLIAFGLLALGVVLFLNFTESIRKAWTEK